MPRHMARRASPSLQLGEGLTIAANTAFFVAEIIANLFGVSYLAAIASVLHQINTLCDNVKRNRTEVKMLCHRCAYLAWGLFEEYGPSALQSDKLQRAIMQVTLVVTDVHAKMVAWAKLSASRAFLLQHRIKDEIIECNHAIENCLAALQLTMHFTALRAQRKLIDRCRRDSHLTRASLERIETRTAFLDPTKIIAKPKNDIEISQSRILQEPACPDSLVKSVFWCTAGF